MGLFLLLFASIHSTARADSYDLIICGKGGEAVYDRKFADWGTRLKSVLIQGMGHASDHVVLLTEPKTGEANLTPSESAETRLDGIRKSLGEFAKRITPADVFFVYLIGHGSYQNGESKLMIDGPDLSAPELNNLLGDVHAHTIVLINGASSSAGFINVLSGVNRIICSSTKSVDESNATDFMEYFIKGLEDGSADLDRDERISVFEACKQAATLTQAAYADQGFIATEHALLDDNGDKLGTRLVASVNEGRRGSSGNDPMSDAAGRDGDRAEHCFLKDFSFPTSVPRAMIDSYLASLDAVDQLKRGKATMKADEYSAQLETLLIKAATLHRDIRKKSQP